MHNNEFEKKVELRLEELSFTPSDAVWQNVELQIRQRKRRRRFFFWWLPVGLLCLGTAGWFLYYSTSSAPVQEHLAVVHHLQNTDASSSAQPVTSTKKEQVVAEGEINKKESIAKNVNEKPTVKKAKQQEVPVAVQQVNSNKTKAGKQTILTESKQPAAVVFKPTVQHKESIVKKESNTTPLQPVVKKEEEVVKHDAVVTNKKEEIKTGEPVVVNKKEEVKPEPVAVVSQPEVKATDVAVATSPQEKIVADSSTTASNVKPAAQKPASPTKRKVEWFARLGTGVSDMSEFSSVVFAPFAADAYSSGSQSSAGSGTVYNRQSPVKPGTGFSAGIELRTIAKKRSSFSVGFNYAYYSTSLKTGSMVYANTLFNVSNYNSYVNNYMRAGDSATFHNHYNYFELPFLYHLRISKQQKRPLSLNTGLSYNYMFASNANYYSRSSGAYYYDKSLFNHSQLHFKLGLSSSFIKKEDYPLQVGLQYQFGMTGIWKQSLTLNQHLSYTGIEVLWRLCK